MPHQKRRNFLKLTGGVIGLGTALASSGSVGATTATQEDLPPLRGPYADEDWVEFRAGPGNTGVIDEAPDVDADGQDCTLFYDGPFTHRPAIVDDRMYVVDGDGIRALDVQDGSVLWTRDVEGVQMGMTAAYGKLITRSLDETDPHDNFTVLRAHDVEDGSLVWEREFDHDTSTYPSVAYEMIYIEVRGVTYALDVADGSTVWEADVGFISRNAVLDGVVYTTDTAGSEHERAQLVALDAFTGEERWRIAEEHGIRVTATGGRVAANRGPDEATVYDADSRDPILTAESHGDVAHDDDAFVTTNRTILRTYFFDDRDDWQFGDFESDSLSNPTIAGDQVYVYVGDAGSEYDYSLVALDTYTGEVDWTREVEAVDLPRRPEIVATSDAVYVLGDEEIHALHDVGVEHDYCDDDDSTDEEDSTEEDDSTETDDDSTPDDSTGDDEASTPDDSSTPEESTDDDCGCPEESSNDDTSSGGDESTSTDEDSTTEDGSSGTSSESTDEDYAAAENGTSTEEGSAAGETEETAGDGPGLGVASAVASLGGIGYVLRRRLGDDESNPEDRER